VTAGAAGTTMISCPRAAPLVAAITVLSTAAEIAHL
jgi:hypothetical protein